jgi:hypothetical protein
MKLEEIHVHNGSISEFRLIDGRLESRIAASIDPRARGWAYPVWWLPHIDTESEEKGIRCMIYAEYFRRCIDAL